MTLYAYVLYIPVQRHAWHYTFFKRKTWRWSSYEWTHCFKTILEQTKWKNNELCNRIHLNVVQSCVRLRVRSCAWSRTHDMMQTDLNPCFATRRNHEARNSCVKHCSGSRRITSYSEFIRDTWRWSSYVYPWFQKDLPIINQRTVECSKRGGRTKKEKNLFTRYTVLCSTTHSFMRMISYARHDADGFESMLCNQTEPWSKRFICETLLWLPTHHIMRMISCARHDAGGFLIASCTGVVGWSHCRTWRMQRFTYLWISAVFECMTHCSSYRAH